MEIIFAKEYLKELQLTGKTSDRRYRFQPDIVKRYRKTIDRLAGARRIEDLFHIASLGYEKLSGDKKGLSSEMTTFPYVIS